LAFNIDSADKIANIGPSMDAIFCTYKDDDVKKCFHVIDKRKGELCEEHVMVKYHKRKANRAEFGAQYDSHYVPYLVFQLD
jgi:hypothetical protein